MIAQRKSIGRECFDAHITIAHTLFLIILHFSHFSTRNLVKWSHSIEHSIELGGAHEVLQRT